ncbi:MAG TPA: prenyltransferase/squalene oxidase repeat-containing protein, partial [Gemmata sp.]|nr:prenyltransferase/squalene oxidase repeat-containing protein [Gemmata sp.]
RHPYTGANPGGWAWTDLPGGVPDCDDTPGALLAIRYLSSHLVDEEGDPLHVAFASGQKWMASIQNRDGGFPTFCRGWGTLPFDRSGSDLTAHAIRAISPQNGKGLQEAAFRYLAGQQYPDGSWLPLWFGNQHAPDDINPVYGTSRVLAAYRVSQKDSPECQRGVNYLLSVQNADGGWGGAKDCPSSVEETALAVEVLLDLQFGDGVKKGVLWLIEAVESGRFREPSPIGFYFAKLWYYEKLYPLIFTVAALGRALRNLTSTSSPEAGSV